MATSKSAPKKVRSGPLRSGITRWFRSPAVNAVVAAASYPEVSRWLYRIEPMTVLDCSFSDSPDDSFLMLTTDSMTTFDSCFWRAYTLNSLGFDVSVTCIQNGEVVDKFSRLAFPYERNGVLKDGGCNRQVQLVTDGRSASLSNERLRGGCECPFTTSVIY